MNNDFLDYFSYSKDTGKIYWNKVKQGRGKNKVKIGDEAGSVNNKGYINVIFFGKSIKAHRLAWFLHYGFWPKNQIDHLNNDRTDNRILNLKEVTTQMNCQNKKIHKNKLIGTTFSRGKWVSQIRINGKKTRLGSFDTELEAHQKYMEVYGQLSVR